MEEEEAQKKKAAEEEAERQGWRASAERAQARQYKATQRLTGMEYDVNTAQKVPGASVVVTMIRRAPCTRCIANLMVGQCKPGQEEADDKQEVGGEGDEPMTPLKGPLGAGVHTWWVEWEWEQQLQAMERQAEVHEVTALAFERMAEAAVWTANEWGLYHTWVEWVEMRRREDVQEARMAELKRTGRGWKRPQSEVVEDQQEEVDEGAEGDNEEEVKGEQEGGEEQEGGREQAMQE
ncbi:hypothetical protein M404DRAFT_27281 [Pisolithus tinctorius Marx 270]|uniref:Uncharacterized protein n=1 Tax=Pisolithus tinctorius Marx 270 TaxID=870435 RepID=A0A0C3K159_PISTI|nr:hypothetical protein M404DRAFT_27281 [Pisolithus tinctorius Marx 270]